MRNTLMALALLASWPIGAVGAGAPGAPSPSSFAVEAILVPGATGCTAMVGGDDQTDEYVDFSGGGDDQTDEWVTFSSGGDDKTDEHVDFSGGDDQTDEHVTFQVRFGGDGLLRARGDVGVPYDPEGTYRIALACEPADGGWSVRATVVDEATGVTIYAAAGALGVAGPVVVRLPAAALRAAAVK